MERPPQQQKVKVMKTKPLNWTTGSSVCSYRLATSFVSSMLCPNVAKGMCHDTACTLLFFDMMLMIYSYPRERTCTNALLICLCTHAITS